MGLFRISKSIRINIILNDFNLSRILTSALFDFGFVNVKHSKGKIKFDYGNDPSAIYPPEKKYYSGVLKYKIKPKHIVLRIYISYDRIWHPEYSLLSMAIAPSIILFFTFYLIKKFSDDRTVRFFLGLFVAILSFTFTYLSIKREIQKDYKTLLKDIKKYILKHQNINFGLEGLSNRKSLHIEYHV